MKLVEGFDSNYRYILVAARRARQLQSGSRPMVDTDARKPCKIAREEIAAGKVKWSTEAPRSAADVANEILEQAISKVDSLAGATDTRSGEGGTAAS